MFFGRNFTATLDIVTNMWLGQLSMNRKIFVTLLAFYCSASSNACYLGIYIVSVNAVFL